MDTENYEAHRTMLLKSLVNRGVKAPAKDFPELSDPDARIAQIAAMRAMRDEIDNQRLYTAIFGKGKK